MWLLFRRLLMTMVAGWVMEKAIQRWPRMRFARRLIGTNRYART